MKITHILRRLAVLDALPSAGASLDTAQRVCADYAEIEAELCKPEHAPAIVRAFVKARAQRWRNRLYVRAADQERTRIRQAEAKLRMERNKQQHAKKSAPRQRPRRIGSNPIYARDTWRGTQ